MLARQLPELQGKMESSGLRRPMTLHASDTVDGHAGDVYAIIDQPLSAISTALSRPEQWCAFRALQPAPG